MSRAALGTENPASRTRARDPITPKGTVRDAALELLNALPKQPWTERVTLAIQKLEKLVRP